MLLPVVMPALLQEALCKPAAASINAISAAGGRCVGLLLPVIMLSGATGRTVQTCFSPVVNAGATQICC